MQESEKVPFVVAKRIREAILDEVFKPGDRLAEVELAEKFEVSRSPVREALLALEKKGTVIISPYKGAIVKPLSAEEVLDIAELRLALISLTLKPAHRHLSPADTGQFLRENVAKFRWCVRAPVKCATKVGDIFFQVGPFCKKCIQIFADGSKRVCGAKV